MDFLEFLKIETLDGHPEELQIDIIGTLIDLSLDNNSLEGIGLAFKLANELNQENLKPGTQTVLLYDLANGWANTRRIKYTNSDNSWQFQMEELTNEIICLRKAIASPGFAEIEPDRQCQIFTNLGACFQFIGRFVEAQNYFRMAVEINPNFAMAKANMANGMIHYARALYDNVHINIFFGFAYHHFIGALVNKQYIHQDALAFFQSKLDWLKEVVNKYLPNYRENFLDLDYYDLGDNPELISYRIWCLSNTLYINPLNDLGAHTVASHDCLHLPTVTLPSNRAPACLNLYNQIKQEFGTARYCFYLGTSGGDIHISDIDVPLTDTMETVRYSFYIEQVKIAFRLAYSILDKIAYLLNDYLQLGIDLNKVSFRTLWYSKQKQLRPFFEKCDNWALRGLYWLSMDLYENDSDFNSVIEPDAREVALIRNYIEHKGFKVLGDHAGLFDDFKEPDISYAISRTSFNQKTLKLLKLTRAALIYLAVAISHEENKKDQSGLNGVPIMPMDIPDFMRT